MKNKMSKIKKCRILKELTQLEVWRETGILPTRLSKIERNRVKAKDIEKDKLGELYNLTITEKIKAFPPVNRNVLRWFEERQTVGKERKKYGDKTTKRKRNGKAIGIIKANTEQLEVSQ